MKWGTVGEIRRKLQKRWDSGALIRELAAGELSFPCRFSLKKPNSKEISDRFEEVRNWSLQLDEQSLKAPWELEKTELNHRQLGRNRIPSAMVFPGLKTLLDFIGKRKEFERYLLLSGALTDAFPELWEWTLQKPHKLLEQDFALERLIHILDWIKDNPRPGIYLRQLSLDGVDTKFIESRRGILSEWLDRILDEGDIDGRYKGVRHFEGRYGFLGKPELVRMRFPHAPDSPFGFSDLSVRADEFCRTEIQIKRVFIIENDVTALAFPPLPGSLVLFGRGYHFNALEEARWLNDKELYYWGDLDTHGFAILSQFRRLFPRTVSLMMDRETLLEHKFHWGREEKPVSTLPVGLTESEESLFKDLAENGYGTNVRMEQEFISYTYVNEALGAFKSIDKSS